MDAFALPGLARGGMAPPIGGCRTCGGRLAMMRSGREWCTHWNGLNRRRWLQVSGVGFLGTLGAGHTVFASPSDQRATLEARHIKACILIFHYGGPSQLETFDPKPEAPSGIRGEYQA